MTILISDNSPRISYTATSGQTAFTVPFEFFDNTDLNVYINDTLQTLTTHYTVTGGDGSTGSITLVTGATAGDVVVITRDVTLERTTDFPTSGPFQVASLNTELDKVVAMIADMKDLADRGLRLSDSDTTVNLTVPDKDTRKGTVLAFNETTGAVEVGPTIADTNSIAQIKADIATLADIQDGTVATNAITNLSAVSSDVTTAASNITEIQNASANAATATTKASEASASAAAAASSESSASTSASNASSSASAALTSENNAASSATSAASAQSAAESARDSALAAYDNFDDRYLGVKSSDPTVDNDGDALVAGALYFNSTSEKFLVYTGSAWVDAYADGTTLVSKSGDTMTGNLSFGDNNKAIFGAGSDLEIYHDGYRSVIQEAGGGPLRVQANTLSLTNTGNNAYFTAFSHGAATIYHASNAKLATTSTGINVTGTVVSDGLTVDGLIKFSGLAPTVDYDFNADGSVTSADSLAYNKMGLGLATTVDISSVDTIAPSWSALSGNTYSDNKFRIMSARGSSTDALRISSSSTAEGYGDTTIIGNVDVNGVNTRLVSGLGISGEDINLVSDSNINFRTAGSTRLDIDSIGDIRFYEDTGTTAKLMWDASDEALEFADNSKAIFGAGSDLQIYHDATDNHIVANTSNLNIGVVGGGTINLGDKFGNTLLQINDNADVKLFHGTTPAEKLATTSTGIDVTGTVTADGLTVDGQETINKNYTFGASNYHIKLGEDSADSYIGNVNGSAFLATGNYYGSNQYTLTGGGTALSGIYADGGSGVSVFAESGLTANSTNTRKQRMLVSTNGDISFYEDTGTTAKLFWDASAEALGLGTTSPDSIVTIDKDVSTAYSATDDAAQRSNTNTLLLKNEDGTANSFAQIAFDLAGSNQSIARIVGINDGTSTSALAFVTEGNNTKREVMRLDGSGNVGIGTDSPDSALMVTDDSNYKVRIGFNGTSQNIYDANENVFRAANGTEIGRFRSNGRLGIGTSSPLNKLDLAEAGDTQLRITSTDGNNVRLGLNSSGTVYNWIEANGTNLLFAVGNAERMRIDSSGNLLVGTTDTSPHNNSGATSGGIALHSDSYLSVGRSSGAAMFINRQSNDGDIIDFRKDGSPIGSIGVNNVNNLYIESDTTDHTGFEFGNDILPRKSNSTADNLTNLGSSSIRFANLYLGGGVFLGGTGLANKLEDYEEGTFTPVLADATSGGNTATTTVTNGIYTKIGRLVHVDIYFVNIDTSGMTSGNAAYITNLPFTSLSGNNFSTGFPRIDQITVDGVGIAAEVAQGQTYIRLKQIISGAEDTNVIVGDFVSGYADFFLGLTYTTNT